MMITDYPNQTIKRVVRPRAGSDNIEYNTNVDWKGNPKPNNNYRWYLWEYKNQRDRPAAMVLVLKDGDPDNITYENLEMITRSEQASRNRKRGKF